VAYEVAQQLLRKGETVAALVLFDSPFPTAYLIHYQIRNSCLYLLDRIPHHLRNLATLEAGTRIGYVLGRVRDFTRQAFSANRDTRPSEHESSFKAMVAHATLEAVRAYRPEVFPGKVHLFVASNESLRQNYGRQSEWSSYAERGLDLHVGPDGCTGDTMLRDPYAKHFGDRLRACIDLQGG
jgi:thioesterase domain-containing protein